jgi:hypothetical protein
MVQNERFIQYLGLLLFTRLKEKENFLECPVWKLYLKLKQICQLVCSDTISERQKTELEELIHSFIDIRIALHMKWKSLQKKNKTPMDLSIYDHIGNLFSTVAWPNIKPKHTFLVCYPMIMKEIGSLAHGTTLRKESKNGKLKKVVQKANTMKNVTKTIMNNENYVQARFVSKGLFSEPNLSIGKNSVLDPECPLQCYIVENSFLSCTLADEITYKNTYYCVKNSHSVLIYNRKKREGFELGIMKKFVIMNTALNQEDIVVIYQKSQLTYIPNFDIYRVTTSKQFGHIKITDVADRYPIYPCNVKSKSECPELYISLRSLPYVE